MHHYILTLFNFGILSIAFAIAVALPSPILSSTTNSGRNVDSNAVSQAVATSRPVIKIDLDTIANDDAASTNKPTRLEVEVELELSVTLPLRSGLEEPASFSSPSSSAQFFYYGWAPLDQSVDVVRAAITEGPQDVKCKLYNYIAGSDDLGYDEMVLTVGNALDFKKGPFQKVSNIDCVAGKPQ